MKDKNGNQIYFWAFTLDKGGNPSGRMPVRTTSREVNREGRALTTAKSDGKGKQEYARVKIVALKSHDETPAAAFERCASFWSMNRNGAYRCGWKWTDDAFDVTTYIDIPAPMLEADKAAHAAMQMRLID